MEGSVGFAGVGLWRWGTWIVCVERIVSLLIWVYDLFSDWKVTLSTRRFVEIPATCRQSSCMGEISF